MLRKCVSQRRERQKETVKQNNMNWDEGIPNGPVNAYVDFLLRDASDKDLSLLGSLSGSFDSLLHHIYSIGHDLEAVHPQRRTPTIFNKRHAGRNPTVSARTTGRMSTPIIMRAPRGQRITAVDELPP